MPKIIYIWHWPIHLYCGLRYLVLHLPAGTFLVSIIFTLAIWRGWLLPVVYFFIFERWAVQNFWLSEMLLSTISQFWGLPWCFFVIKIIFSPYSVEIYNNFNQLFLISDTGSSPSTTLIIPGENEPNMGESIYFHVWRITW